MCRFESIVARDGSELFGFEATVIDGNELVPGSVGECWLRLWAGDQLGRPVPVGTTFHIFEGHEEVAVGEVMG